jgi:hypothetical protein
MSTLKTAPILGAAAVGLFSVMGTAMAAAQPVSQIVLSDEAEVTFVGRNNGDYYSDPAPTRGSWGKGAGAGQASRNHQRGGRGL